MIETCLNIVTVNIAMHSFYSTMTSYTGKSTIFYVKFKFLVFYKVIVFISSFSFAGSEKKSVINYELVDVTVQIWS